MASLASRAADNDPIDLAVMAGLKDAAILKSYRQEKYVPFDPVNKRTEATACDAAGKVFRVTKGAPQVILGLAQLSAVDRAKAEQIVDSLAAQGYRAIAVARGAGGAGPWQFLGILPLFDPPRPDSKETIARAVAYGVQVKMVTGDNVAIARQISTQLGMGANIQPATSLFPGDVAKGQIPLDAADKIARADGFAQVFPEHKFAIVKVLQESGHIVSMTGDGVNDAPALKQADVGIAVSGRTEAARAAAALILTAPGLSVIIDGIAEARRIFERMTSYVLYRIAMTLAIMGFVVLASIYYGFFPLTALMLIALALLDDVPIMTIAFDNATGAAATSPLADGANPHDLVGAGIARGRAELRAALPGRHGLSPQRAALADDDVSAVGGRRPFDAVRRADAAHLLGPAVSQRETILGRRRHTNRRCLHVRPGLAGARLALEHHWMGLGL